MFRLHKDKNVMPQLTKFKFLRRNTYSKFLILECSYFGSDVRLTIYGCLWHSELLLLYGLPDQECEHNVFPTFSISSFLWLLNQVPKT
jgi:hypothetical protein